MNVAITQDLPVQSLPEYTEELLRSLDGLQGEFSCRLVRSIRTAGTVPSFFVRYSPVDPPAFRWAAHMDGESPAEGILHVSEETMTAVLTSISPSMHG